MLANSISRTSVNRRRIASAVAFAALTALQFVASIQPATACPVRFTMDTNEKIVTRTVETKVRVMPSETAPVVRGKLISIARRSAPKLTAAALRRNTRAVVAATAPRKSGAQR